jgi:hypothetical protein
LFPVAVANLVSGLEDLALDAGWLRAWAKRRPGLGQGGPGPDGAPPGRRGSPLRAFIASARRDRRDGGAHVAAVNYDRYHFFIGA